jgi:WD40 repeat protein
MRLLSSLALVVLGSLFVCASGCGYRTASESSNSSNLTGSTVLTCTGFHMVVGRYGSGQNPATLATKELSGTSDQWGAYLEFTSPATAECTFSLPAGSLVALAARVNYSGPEKSEQLAVFQLYDTTTSSWVQFADNGFAREWTWSAADLSVPGDLHRFINSGTVRARYVVTAHVDVTQLDQWVMVATTSSTTTPDAGVVAPPTDAGVVAPASDAGVHPPTDASTDTPPSDGGGAGDIAACGNVTLSHALVLAPASATDHYLRCDTRGPETGNGAILSPDASRVAVMTTSGTVRLLASNPWREVAQLAAPIGKIDAVAFAPDGATLATLQAEMGVVTLWRASDGLRGQSFSGPPASTVDTWISALAFSSDGHRLATSLGTVIDLGTGATISTFAGGATLRLAFAPGGGRLLVDSSFQIGNSPTSRWIYIHDLASGADTTLFKMYDRAVTGVAITDDHSLIALAKTVEAGTAGFSPGLNVFRTDTGASVAAAPNFVGTVLGFSHDATKLYTSNAGNITVLATSDLHVIRTFAWSAGQFLGVSPEDDLVAVSNGATQWWETATGTVRQSLARALTAASWTPDGLYGVGTGDAGAMFAMWREANAVALCTPTPVGGTAPLLASLGTSMDSSGSAVSQDGSIALSTVFVIHTHGTDYTSVHVTQTATGQDLRVFSPTSSRRQVALSNPNASQLYSIEGQAVAVWCR